MEKNNTDLTIRLRNIQTGGGKAKMIFLITLFRAGSKSKKESKGK
jgi:hypothetical protein